METYVARTSNASGGGAGKSLRNEKSRGADAAHSQSPEEYESLRGTFNGRDSARGNAESRLRLICFSLWPSIDHKRGKATTKANGARKATKTRKKSPFINVDPAALVARIEDARLHNARPVSFAALPSDIWQLVINLGEFSPQTIARILSRVCKRWRAVLIHKIGEIKWTEHHWKADKDIRQAIAAHPSLTNLKILSRVQSRIPALTDLPSTLKHLSISCNVKETWAALLTTALDNLHLAHIALAFNGDPLAHGPDSLLCPLMRCSVASLTSLGLSNSVREVKKTDSEFLAITHFPALTVLDFSEGRFSCAEAREHFHAFYERHASQLQTLRIVDDSRWPLLAETLAIIAKQRYLALQDITLSRVHPAEFSSLGKNEQLNITLTEFDVSALLVRLVPATHLHSCIVELRHLKLRGTTGPEVHPESLTALTCLTRLREFSLYKHVGPVTLPEFLRSRISKLCVRGHESRWPSRRNYTAPDAGSSLVVYCSHVTSLSIKRGVLSDTFPFALPSVKKLKFESFTEHTAKVLKQIMKKSPRLERLSLRLSHSDNFPELATILATALQKDLRELKVQFANKNCSNSQKAFALELQKMAAGGWKKVKLLETTQ